MDRIIKLLGKIASKKAGFAATVAMLSNEESNGYRELLVVQTTRNANVTKLQRKHNAVLYFGEGNPLEEVKGLVKFGVPYCRALQIVESGKEVAVW